VLHRVAVLSRDDHGVDALDRVAVVLERDLRLTVGADPRNLLVLAQVGQLAAERVCVIDGRGHQVRRLRAGEAEHEPLVAGALLGVLLAFRVLLIHALRDVRALRRQRVHDMHAARVEGFARVDVTNLLDRAPHHLVVIEIGLGRDLARDDDEVRFHHRLARDAAVLVLRQAGVEDRIGNRIGDLVGMPLGDRFGRENVGFGHSVTIEKTACGCNKIINVSGCVDI
jgi:hypothetical protein